MASRLSSVGSRNETGWTCLLVTSIHDVIL
jgi:hypothetical protein